MKTDWENYRQLEKGEIIRSYDQQLSPEGDGHEGDGDWDEVSTCRVGTPASDPKPMGHMIYRRPLHLDNAEVRDEQ
ncbi:MAG: hypothetical protein AAGJ81_10640 [Verrucomicrobiota bacterium]